MTGPSQTNQRDTSDEPVGMKLHMGIAEQGKVYALEGDHSLALHYYREAMRMTVQAEAPEVFFRHYLECVMESLEHMMAYPEVLEYCERAIQFYQDNPPPNEVATMDLAHIYQRKGINLLKMGIQDEASVALQQALETARAVGKVTSKTMPLAQTMLRWLRSRLHIDDQRMIAEQHRTQYFMVRKDTVEPEKAVRLPNENVISF